MALNIKDPTTEELARELARETGTSITAAVRTALTLALDSVRRRRNRDDLFRELLEISDRAARMPDSGRPLTDFLDYDDNGLPV